MNEKETALKKKKIKYKTKDDEKTLHNYVNIDQSNI